MTSNNTKITDLLYAAELAEDALSELGRLDDGTCSISALHALRQALAALNTVPRFAVPSLSTNSYAIASLCDAAIREAEGGG